MTSTHRSLVLASRLDSLQRLEAFITDVMERNCLDDDMRGNVMISALEAVTNAIRHGNGIGSAEKVHVDVFEEADQLEIVVRDRGNGFCPEQVDDPTDPTLLLREGGRGVYLIRALTDECDFEDEGRTVRMAFSCVCSQPSSVAAAEPALA